eukprot:scaffold2473_cov247-Pinguiococcus_pyrenoidosus.AAC.3
MCAAGKFIEVRSSSCFMFALSSRLPQRAGRNMAPPPVPRPLWIAVLVVTQSSVRTSNSLEALFRPADHFAISTDPFWVQFVAAERRDRRRVGGGRSPE